MKKRLASTAAALAAVSALAMAAPAVAQPSEDLSSITVQNGFDDIGIVVHQMKQGDRTIYYIDEGNKDGIPLLFLGGWGTSLEGFSMTEFVRTLRNNLGIRVVSVERNGIGASEYDPKLGFDDYNKEVLAVLDKLGITKFHIAAISGGGTFATHLASTVPDRVASIHLAAASASQLQSYKPSGSADLNGADLGNLSPKGVDAMINFGMNAAHNVKDWWRVDESSPALRIPGWQERAYLDGLRAFYIGGQMGSPLAMLHEYFSFVSKDNLVDPKAITAPAFLYYGDEDTAVDEAHFEAWQALPNVVRATLYPGIGHTVQYRHWGQVLLDVAGQGKYTLVCRDGTSRIVASEGTGEDDFLGICAWQD